MNTTSDTLGLGRENRRTGGPTRIQSKPQLPDGGCSRWLALGSALALLLGAHPAQAATVVFDGGRTDTLSDASFQNDEIRVRNGSHLIINPGAVLGGQGANSGRIRVFDSSKVTIFGGIFGGPGVGAGSLIAGGVSQITIHDGTFGGQGNESGMFSVNDSATVVIHDGTFGGPGKDSGAINPRGTSSLTIHRGIFGASGESSGLVISRDSSVVMVHDGTFGALGAGSGGFQALGNSRITINGGGFGGSGEYSGNVYSGHDTEVTIQGGSFGSTGTYSALLHTWATGALTIQGGSFGGSGLGSGTYFVTDESTMTIRSASFDTTAYDPDSGGRVGFAFPGQPPQSITGVITGGRVRLEIVAPAPELRMVRTASGLEMSWTRSEADHELTSVGGLTGSGIWTKWPGAPVSEGDRWVVRLVVPESESVHRFFRLQAKQ